MSLQNLLINQAINKIKQNPAKSFDAINLVLLSPKIDLDDSILFLFEISLDNLQGHGARHIANFLHKFSISLNNSHLFSSLADLLIKHDQNLAYRLIKWNKNLIKNKKVLTNIKYNHRDSLMFEEIFDKMISGQEQKNLDIFINHLIEESPSKISFILSFFRKKNITLNLDPAFSGLSNKGYNLDLIKRHFSLVGKVTNYSLSLHRIIVDNSSEKIEASNLFLSGEVKLNGYYLVNLAFFIKQNELLKLYETFLDVYKYDFVDSSVILALFQNRSLKPDTIISFCPNQSLYNSLLNCISFVTNKIEDKYFIEMVFYYFINSHFFKTCYNYGVISEVFFSITKLEKSKKTDNLKLSLINNIDIEKLTIPLSFLKSFSQNEFDSGISYKILSKLKMINSVKVADEDFVARILTAVNQKDRVGFIKTNAFRFYELNNNKFTNFLKHIIKKHDLYIEFLKSRKHLLNNGQITKSDMSGLSKICMEEMTVSQRLRYLLFL